jgi:hypothetical protein
MARKKNNHSTKQDNVPTDDAMRKEMIEKFIAENAEDENVYQRVDAVPYESGQFVRSTAGTKRKSD